MKIKTSLFLILLVLSVTRCVFAESNIDIFAENILNYFKNNNYETLYEKMSEETKKVMPYNDMVRFLKLEKEELGALERYNKLDSLEQMLGNKQITILRYAAYFQNTGAVIVLYITEEGEQLICQKFHIDSLIFGKPEVQKRFEQFVPISPAPK